MDREIIFEKVYSKTRKFILKWNLRYTSSMMGPSNTSEVGWAWQNIQDYICHKSEHVF